MSSTDNTILPKHVGIIMDGNGRWAKARGLPRVAGHREGAKTVDRIVTACRKKGIKALTLYAFSSQNWTRPSLEIKALMQLLGEYIKKERKTILKNNIQLNAIGDLDQLPDNPKKALLNLMEESKKNSKMTLTLALSYGGQEEITAAAKAIAKKVKQNILSPDEITVSSFNREIWSSSLGPLDLIIRTSGELRISNFMLWSAAYAEFFFSSKMWPDFQISDLEDAFEAFSKRDRRFGDLGD
jgi:undecaprenyl diphosphate synthase